MDVKCEGCGATNPPEQEQGGHVVYQDGSYYLAPGPDLCGPVTPVATR